MPKVVIHASLKVKADRVVEFREFLKKITKLSNAEPGTEYFRCKLCPTAIILTTSSLTSIPTSRFPKK
jgi:hypothetical protein